MRKRSPSMVSVVLMPDVRDAPPPVTRVIRGSSRAAPAAGSTRMPPPRARQRWHSPPPESGSGARPGRCIGSCCRVELLRVVPCIDGRAHEGEADLPSFSVEGQQSGPRCRRRPRPESSPCRAISAPPLRPPEPLPPGTPVHGGLPLDGKGEGELPIFCRSLPESERLSLKEGPSRDQPRRGGSGG